MNFLIFLSGESRTPFIDVSGHSGRQHRFYYDETNKCMALDGKPSDSARLAEVSEDLIGVKGCFKVHLKCIEEPAEDSEKPAETAPAKQSRKAREKATETESTTTANDAP